MALIDVSALLSDPDFVDTIIVTRVTQTVNAYGVVTATSSTINVRAAVYPAGGRILELLPEAERGSGTITVLTTYGLIERSATQTDEITWAGKQWRVEKVNDYRNWGGGFVEAMCRMKSPTE